MRKKREKGEEKERKEERGERKEAKNEREKESFTEKELISVGKKMGCASCCGNQPLLHPCFKHRQ